mgnify:CR=1 FL=1|tara:strand:- start:7458 stop:7763 length:306 start_codon:yes stop_codon:yes gene_type:complete
MAATFTWTIPTVERVLADGGITIAHWRCDAVEDTYSAGSYGTVGLTYDADAADFIAYDSVTEADVIGWVQAEINQSDTETALQRNIDEQKTPTTASGTPWE